MSSTSEKGFAKMLGNFNSLISYCTGYGGKYVPSRKALQVPQLQALYQSAQGQLAAVKTAEAANAINVNQRQLVYEPVKDRAKKVLYSLASCGADVKIIDDAKTINRKVQGTRLPKAKQADAAEVPDESKTISTAQLSFDSLLDNFKKLVELVSAEPKYKPNEPELAIAGLTTFANEMQAANQTVIDSTTALSNARISRNTVLYAEPDSMVPVADAAKVYLRSVFKVSGPEYKQESVN
jgi:hypothetical protein